MILGFCFGTQYIEFSQCEPEMTPIEWINCPNWSGSKGRHIYAFGIDDATSTLMCRCTDDDEVTYFREVLRDAKR